MKEQNEKQAIEEMAHIVSNSIMTWANELPPISNPHFVATNLYNAGYRKQEWISVDERLPHSQQMVIGYTPCDGYMFVGFYQKVDSPYYKSYWNIITAMRSTRKMTKKVTHWMPLPDAPKGGAE